MDFYHVKSDSELSAVSPRQNLAAEKLKTERTISRAMRAYRIQEIRSRRQRLSS